MNQLQELVTELFMLCVYVLQVIGGAPGEYGFGYYLANVIIFVIVQPALIILFFVLWRLERKKNAIAASHVGMIKSNHCDG